MQEKCRHRHFLANAFHPFHRIIVENIFKDRRLDYPDNHGFMAFKNYLRKKSRLPAKANKP